MGHFHEHIDTWHPTQWFRLWGTTRPDGMVIRFEGVNYDKEIEPGRLYLIDTVLRHEGLAYIDNVYQLFFERLHRINQLLSFYTTSSSPSVSQAN